MIKIFNSRIAAFFCILLAIAMISSCEKNNDADSGMVQLLSFGPTGAKPGDTIQFIGTNLQLVTAIQLTGASVDQTAFIKQNSELITLVVPVATQQGFVTLKSPQGDITSKTKLNLLVPVKIKTMTAEARPGDNITITGDYLTWVTRVTFGKDKNVDSFVTKTLNQLVVKVPADAQSGTLQIAYGGTKPLVIETDSVLKVTLPIATQLAPNPVKHAGNLTITGTNLDLVKSVLFTGTTTAVTTLVSQTATQVVVTVPASAKSGKISLVAASEVASESAASVNILLPVITSITPNPIDVGANLVINGTNLDLITGVSFTGVLAQVKTFISQSATQLVVQVPAGSLKGKLTFAVANSTLTVESEELKLNGGLPALADFPFPIYTDAAQNGFQDWSYTDTHNFNSTANVRQGTKSIKAVYGVGGYTAINLHNTAAVSTTGYTRLEFSVFGEAGTGGKKLNIVFDGNYGAPVGQVTLLEGEWATFSLNLSSLGNPATVTEIILQSAGWGGTVHIDHVGLR